jgi:hypothetical protein
LNIKLQDIVHAMTADNTLKRTIIKAILACVEGFFEFCYHMYRTRPQSPDILTSKGSNTCPFAKKESGEEEDTSQLEVLMPNFIFKIVIE